MTKTAPLHHKAYLKSRRNVKAGLVSRTKILLALEEGRKSVKDVAKEAELTYSCVIYHLKAMKKDRLVEKQTKTKQVAWTLTPYGQQKLPT